MLFRKIFSGALLVTILAACGGGSGNQNSSSGNEATAGAQGSPGAMMTAGAMNAASPGAVQGNSMQGGNMQAIESRPQAPIPASLNCGSDQPVWTNPRSHAFFEASAPFYGRTKSGTYMCPKDAIAAGYHMASGKRRHHGGGGMEGAAPSPAST